MTVIGRTYRPFVDEKRCNTCSICTQQCPAYADEGFQKTDGSLRQKITQSFDAPPTLQVTPIPAASPPCQTTCPIHQDVRGYLRAVAEGRHADAIAIIRKTNPLPLICGTICPHPCETACFRGILDDPVGIRAVKRFAALYEKRNTLKPEIPVPASGKQVAVIGSGPAGIAAAYTLIQQGIRPFIFEKTSRIGGMLAWAIPEFRLPRDILAYEFEVLTSLGITFRTNQGLGTELTLDTLERDGFDAILLAVGTTRGRKVSLEGEHRFKNHLDCLSYLFSVHRGAPPEMGDSVAVIGGGNAAIDTARVLKRTGAANVTVLYRRLKGQMPADKEEVTAAERENIQFLFSSLPTRISQKGRTWTLSGYKTQSIDRNHPVEILKDRPFSIPVTGIISAIQQVPETDWAEREGIDIASNGCLRVDEAHQTARKGTFAAGDAVTGPSTVVAAMADGMAAAESILNLLKGENRP